MNTKISKLLGIGLTIATLATLMVGAIPASAADPEVFANEPGPSTLPTGSQTLIVNSDLTDFAVAKDGTTVYAISGNTTKTGPSATAKMVLKSTNGGAVWTRSTTALGTVTSANITTPYLIAVAPDDANVMAMLGAGVPTGDNNTLNTVYKMILTSDGGLTYSEITLSATNALATINDLAISATSGGVRYIAIAGATAGNVAEIQYLNVGALVSSWKSMTVSADPNWAGFANPASLLDTAVTSISFSPNFASDKVMVAVINSALNGAVVEIASFSSYKWNAQAGFTTYPKVLGAATRGFPDSTVSSIAMPPTYLGADETLRQEFIGIGTTNSTGGIYYVKDSGTAVTVVQSGFDFRSVAYNGSDLVAGAYSTNQVFYCANPTATIPTVSETTSNQRPGGASNVIVAWAGTNVAAGTAGANSAYAVSKDKGATFNDVSLVDNRIADIRDFAVSPDGGIVYTISDDNVTFTQLNVWRKSAGTWEKVLSLTGLTNTTTYIVRTAPDNADNVYIANTAGTDMYYSGDKGEKSWQLRSLIEKPADVAVESAQVVYSVTTSGKVFKSVNSGFTWDTGTATGLTGAATIVSIKKDQLIVGGSAGTVAWSTDGSAAATTWVAKTLIFAGTAGITVVTADKLDTGGFVYVACNTPGQDIRRFKIGTSVVWDDINIGGVQVNGTNAGVYSIGLRDGTLNVLAWDGGTRSALERILAPTTADASTEWSAISVNGEPATLSAGSFVSGMPAPVQYFDQWLKQTRAMQISSDGKVWALNNRMFFAAQPNTYSDQIYSIIDTIYKTGPAPTIPADKASPATNPVTGRAEDVAFSWPRLIVSSVPASVENMTYKLEIALDVNFTQKILTPTVTPNPPTSDPVVQVVGPYQANTFAYNFAPGTTYYWRVKMTSPLESAWSATRSFTFSSLAPFKLSSPNMGATDVPVNPILNWTAYSGAKWYELTLSQDPSFAIPEWSHNVYNLFYTVTTDETLKFNTTYYWRVRGVTADPYVQGSAVITPAGPYVIGAFTTMSQPVTTAPPPVIVSTVTSSAPPTIITLPPVIEKQAQPIPSWMLMTIIVIGAILIIALIILIVRTRRVA